MKEFEPPEKSFFSIAEIVQRWGCDRSLVEHHISYTKTLRPALITQNLTLPAFEKICGLVASKLDATVTSKEDVIELPEFLYVRPWEFEVRHPDPDSYPDSYPDFDIGDSYFRVFSFFEDYDGKEYALVEGKDYTVFEAKVTGLIITKEERDRFENENGLTLMNENNIDEPLSIRKEEGLLKTVGLLAKAISKIGGTKYSKSDGSVNVNQVAKLLEEILPTDDKGLSERALRDRIKDGLDLLEE